MKKYILETRNQPNKILGGIRLSNNVPIFNEDYDDTRNDVILLRNKASGTFMEEDVEYVYGYEYNPNSDPKDRKAFRRFLKDFNSKSKTFYAEEVDDFVENAVFALDSYHRLKDFEVIVYTQSTSNKIFTLSDVINSYMLEYCRNIRISFELIKQTYSDVEFNVEEAIAALRNKGMNDNDIQDEIEFTVNKFNNLKQTGELFQMKRFIPKEIRTAFHNFLKFKTEEEQKVYESLQGVDVLIYDDFLTSGSTVKEIIRYLKSFNDKNTLTVFVLVKQ